MDYKRNELVIYFGHYFIDFLIEIIIKMFSLNPLNLYLQNSFKKLNLMKYSMLINETEILNFLKNKNIAEIIKENI